MYIYVYVIYALLYLSYTVSLVVLRFSLLGKQKQEPFDRPPPQTNSVR